MSLRLPSLLAAAAAFLAFSGSARPQAAPALLTDRQGIDGLKEVPFQSLSSSAVSVLGQAALSIRPTEWKHAETANFIYHYFHDFVATPVSVEAEFYYRVIARDLGKDTSHWERKGHIFVFESPADWRTFQSRANLDPWTGGIHVRNELFVVRDPAQKFKGNTLGHETAHLVVDRFFGSNVPLWLNEGYAEYVSLIGYATFYRARGYVGRPRFHVLAKENYVPLKELTDRVTYPSQTPQVVAFYQESEMLVRFLAGEDKQHFGQFFDYLSKGSMFDSALDNSYGLRFGTSAMFEEAFKRFVDSSTAEKE